VSGPVEGESLDHLGADQTAQAILRFEQRAGVAELERAGEAGQSAAHHDRSPTPAHKSPASTMKTAGVSLAGPGSRCYRGRRVMSEMLSSLEHLVRKHPSGTVLFREGDRGHTMYVIRSGKVNISKKIGESEITLAMLGPGEFFGEMALLEGLPRSA